MEIINLHQNDEKKLLIYEWVLVAWDEIPSMPLHTDSISAIS